MRLVIIIIIGLFVPLPGIAQTYDSINIKHVELDSFVVRSGFDTKAFIRRVQRDTTFYKAFRTMRIVPYKAQCSFTALDKKGGVVATMNTKAEQRFNSRHCRYTIFTDQKATGNFYNRDKTLHYYTADLFYNLFFSEKPVCGEDDIVAKGFELKDKSRLEKSKYELKQLMFNPGAKVSGVPFMGDRASVFDADEVDKYNYKVTLEEYAGEEVYVFSITPKPEYQSKVVFNELKTWFRRSDYSIMARDYALSFNTLVYDFDVRMKVRMAQINGKIYPTHITYDGNWKVTLKERERMRVVMDIVY
jgi:hypothetical protein